LANGSRSVPCRPGPGRVARRNRGHISNTSTANRPTSPSCPGSHNPAISRAILTLADAQIGGTLSLHCPRAVLGPLKCREMGPAQPTGDGNGPDGRLTCVRILPRLPNPPPPRRRANFHKDQISYQPGTALRGHQQTMKMGHTTHCVLPRSEPQDRSIFKAVKYRWCQKIYIIQYMRLQ
jgi:hypothetical protein